MSVQEYLDKHLLGRRIEDAVNAAVRAKSPDPVLFISNHMRKSLPAAITDVRARQVLDARGVPSVEVEMRTNKGCFRASVSSAAGAAAGNSMYAAAVDLVDGDAGRYLGKGVGKAVAAINGRVSEALIGMDPQLQAQIDQAMIDLDKTENKSDLGANAMLAVSICACKAGAAEKEVPLYKHIADLAGTSSVVLPVPLVTLIDWGNGKPSGSNQSCQEIMIIPTGAKNFEEAVQIASESYHHLKVIMADKYGSDGSRGADYGEFIPSISSISEGLDLVTAAVDKAGYNGRIKLAINVSADQFCAGSKYDLDLKSKKKTGEDFKSGKDLIEMYSQLCTEYPLVSIEQPFDVDDWDNHKLLTALGLCQVVGDELLMGNSKRIERAISEYTCNAAVLKPNQIGTVTETIEYAKLAKDAHWGLVVSQMPGETEETFFADLAVGLSAGQLKAGASSGGERLAKYNQVLRIEEQLGSEAVYAGENWRWPEA